MSEKNLQALGNENLNLPDDLKKFEEESDKLAKGETPEQPAKTDKGESPAPKEGEQSEADQKAKADAEAKAEEEAKSKNTADGKGNLKNTEGDNPSPSMSLSKYKKQKEKWETKLNETVANIEAKHKQEIDELKSSLTKTDATSQSMEADIKKFAEENDIKDVDVINKLAGVILKNLPGQDPETKKAIEEFKAAQKKSAEELGFEKDFLKTAAPILKQLNPNIDEARLQEAKNTLKKYAYDEKYLKLTLDEIISLKKSKFEYNLDKNKTAETSRPGSQASAKLTDYDNWTKEDIENASPKEFEDYSNHMASKSGSVLRVLDINGNEVK